MHTIPTHLTGPFKGWYKDQIDSLNNLKIWNKKTNNLVILKDKDTGFNRLNRNRNTLRLNDIIKKNIKDHKYSDYHALRPFKKFEKINNMIFDLL